MAQGLYLGELFRALAKRSTVSYSLLLSIRPHLVSDMAAEQVLIPPEPAAAAAEEAAPPEPPGLGSDDEDVVDDIESLRVMIKLLRDELKELK